MREVNEFFFKKMRTKQNASQIQHGMNLKCFWQPSAMLRCPSHPTTEHLRNTAWNILAEIQDCCVL